MYKIKNIKNRVLLYIFTLFVGFHAWIPLFSSIKIVLTGGPGVGKTTLIKELEKRGFNVVDEVATIIIEQALEKGLPHPAKDLNSLKIFIDDICRMQKEKEQALQDNKLYFLDRGFHDPVAFCTFYKLPAPSQLLDAATHASYTYVFILDFLDIYENTGVRRESNETSRTLHNLILETYQQYGYTMNTNLFCVPSCLYDEQNRRLDLQKSINKRVDFILRKLASFLLLLISEKTPCNVNPTLQKCDEKKPS